MPITYERCDDDFLATMADVMEQYHGGLHDAEVTVDVLLAHGPRDANGDPSGPAVKDGQYPCAAKIRITNLRERALGHGDAELIVDGDHVDEWSQSELEAVIDHELSHLEFTGERDDLDRPKLKTVPHDHQFGWFDAVARRHGDAAFEVQQAKRLIGDQELVQLYLPGFEVGQAKGALV